MKARDLWERFRDDRFLFFSPFFSISLIGQQIDINRVNYDRSNGLVRFFSVRFFSVLKRERVDLVTA